jgi:magnesium-transporting ATPase (P-type)
MTLLACALCFSGFTALCLAMDKHQIELYGKQRANPQRMRLWRVVGWLLLTLTFALCVQQHGWALGPLHWLGALTVSAMLLTLWLLPYRPRAIAPLAWGLPVLASLCTWLF